MNLLHQRLDQIEERLIKIENTLSQVLKFLESSSSSKPENTKQ
jgi:hypothetical protein